MKGNSAGLKSNLQKVDEHIISKAEYEEIPELSEDFFTKGQLYRDGKPVKRGRPKSANPKVSTTIRLNSEIVTFFKASGNGWQTRINDALLEYVRRHSAVQQKR